MDIKQLKQQIEQVFKREVQEMFDKDQTLTAIYWAQYTDGYNDGEPCEFDVRGVASYHHDPKFDLLTPQELFEATPTYEPLEHPLIADIDYSKRKNLSDIQQQLNEQYMAQFTSDNVNEEDPACKWFFNIKDEEKHLLLFLFGDHVKVLIYKDEETGKLDFFIQEYSDHD